eukprot:12931254-Prorocentrum_lima.AAC.1
MCVLLLVSGLSGLVDGEHLVGSGARSCSVFATSHQTTCCQVRVILFVLQRFQAFSKSVSKCVI